MASFHEDTEKKKKPEIQELISSTSYDNSFNYSNFGKNIASSIQHLKFPVLPNRDSLCWLDSALALLFHSASLKKQPNTSSNIGSLLNNYNKLFNLVNYSENQILHKDLLQSLVLMQNSAFYFLKEKMQCQKGRPDSPIFALSLFLEECPLIRELFGVYSTWAKHCPNCKTTITYNGRSGKSVNTFKKLSKDFKPSMPHTYSSCSNCSTVSKTYLIFDRRMPESMIFHFLEGADNCNVMHYDFQHESESYIVKALITYTTDKIKHFITWIRDPMNNLWLNCNDLQTGFSQFSSSVPDIKPNEIHVILWERASIETVQSTSKCSNIESKTEKSMENVIIENSKPIVEKARRSSRTERRPAYLADFVCDDPFK